MPLLKVPLYSTIQDEALLIDLPRGVCKVVSATAEADHNAKLKFKW